MSTYRNGILAIFASVLLAAMMSFAQNKATSSVPASDHNFMNEAAQGGMAEVEFGRLAEQNGQSEYVKNFGKRMVEDHSKANDELKQVASKEGVTLPTELSAKDQATKESLSKLHGAAFDKAYMKDMVADHEQDIAAFKHEAKDGQNSQVKQWASQTLPTLEEHLKLAKHDESKVVSETSGGKPGNS